MSEHWDLLPDLVLVQVFSYLNRRDKAIVSHVCTRWETIVQLPVIWRYMHVNIDKDLVEAGRPTPYQEINLVYFFTQRHSMDIRRLELAWSRPYILSHQAYVRMSRGIQTDAGASYITFLRKKNVQLQELILRDWIYSYKWGKRERIVCALAKFIRSQKNLQLLSLRNASLSSSELIKLLDGVSFHSRNSLEYLDLRNAIREWETPLRHTKYIKLFHRLKDLTSLYLDYSSISDDILIALSSTQQSLLTKLHISIRGYEYDHMLSDQAWNILITCCPKVRVTFNISNVPHYEDVRFLLTPSIPMTSFHFFSGAIWDQSRSRNFRGTVKLLINFYSHILEDIHLHFKNNVEEIDDLIIELIKRCPNLTNFKYDGVLRRMNTIQDICKTQVVSVSNFHTFYVRPRMLNETNRQIVNQISANYSRELEENAIEFKIEDPSSVITYP